MADRLRAMIEIAVLCLAVLLIYFASLAIKERRGK